MKKETIICAAIWYNDGQLRPHLPKNIDTGIVSAGFRHPNCFTTLSVLFPNRDYLVVSDEERKCKQGFLTSSNRFVDRKEAAKIALEAGQITELKYGNENELYSEDLY